MSKICWLVALDVGDGAMAPMKMDHGMSPIPGAVTLYGAAGDELLGYIDHMSRVRG